MAQAPSSIDGPPPSRLDDDGAEVLDPTPVAMPVKFKRSRSLIEDVQALVQGELSRLADAHGFESFDEADDFDVGEDYDPRSPHELDDGQLEYDIRADERFKKVEEAEAQVRPAKPPEDPETPVAPS